nr:hypothetical protein [Micromonospora sp. DSM 115978]
MKVVILGMATVLASAPAGAYGATGRWPTTVRVSLTQAGGQGDLESWESVLSGNGRYVAFTSVATNLVPGDTNGTTDVFVRDRHRGTTERISIGSDGQQSNDQSFDIAISDDGRHVAFWSHATNLVPDDTNDAYDVFVRDRRHGTTRRVNVNRAGEQSAGGAARPTVSADGRYVAFQSYATDLVPNDTNDASDIFVHELKTGITSLVSVNQLSEQGDSHSEDPRLSADGRYVTYWSHARNLVPNDLNDQVDVFVHDRRRNTTEIVSVSSDGRQGDRESWAPTISANGRYVAFSSDAASLVPDDTNLRTDVFVHDRRTGDTGRISVDDAGGQATEGGTSPEISADGGRVAFISQSPDLVPGDTNNQQDVFIRHHRRGTTERVSVTGLGEQAEGWSWGGSFSADGRFITFGSDAANLVPDDTNGCGDIFIRDRGRRLRESPVPLSGRVG